MVTKRLIVGRGLPVVQSRCIEFDKWSPSCVVGLNTQRWLLLKVTSFLNVSSCINFKEPHEIPKVWGGGETFIILGSDGSSVSTLKQPTPGILDIGLENNYFYILKVASTGLSFHCLFISSYTAY